jgi:hypothetical protein
VTKISWAVAIKSKKIFFELEFATAISKCLQQLGHSVILVEDGDHAGLQTNVLLLLINLANFPQYCHELKKHSKNRPVTVLWQMDPLPPENLTPEAEAAGLKASLWADRFGLHQSLSNMSRWEKLYRLVRLREWADKQCSASGYRKACRLIKFNGGGDFDWKQIRGVMMGWKRLLDSHQQGWVDHFIMSTNQRRRFLASRKIASEFIPVGAHEEMGRDLGLPRDIPVGFLGNIKHGRRAMMLERLEQRLQQNGITLNKMTQDCYGEKRCQWLNRTRILISLHNYSWNPAWIRFLLAAKCGTVIVSEPMNDEHPMVPGIHFISSTLEEMPDTILKLLNDSEKIQQVTKTAAELCDTELTLFQSMKKMSRFVEVMSSKKI